MKLAKLHTNFQLNGISFSSVAELLTFTSNFSEEIHPFLETWFSNTSFISVKTSGTTGVPKEINLKKKQLLNAAFATGKYFDLKENTKALLCLPTAYIAGKMMLIRAITLGWHLDIVKPNATPLKGLQKEYDFAAMIPLQLENSIEALPLIKTLLVGGAAVSRQLQEKIQNTVCTVFATYGMTETCTHIAVKRLHNFSSLQRSTTKQPLDSIFYQTLPNVKIYKDVRNCLVIHAPKVSNEVIFTNDIVHLISDTQFEWLGRFDTIINSGGIKLYPERIEEKLAKIITPRFFVAGISDEKLGEKLILIVALESNKRAKFKKFFNTEIKKITSLSNYEIPKEIYFQTAFIETETKKIARKKIVNLINK